MKLGFVYSGTHCILCACTLYNAIIHEVITSGRGVQLWSSLVGILIIYKGSWLWSPSRCRSKVKGQFRYIFPCRLVCIYSIGFPGQIRKFDNQINFNFIQIRQILSCRENYHSLINRFNFFVKGICIYVVQFKKCLTSIQIRDRTSRRLNGMTKLRK